LRAIALDEANP
jgi:hypothetical protein